MKPVLGEETASPASPKPKASTPSPRFIQRVSCGVYVTVCPLAGKQKAQPGRSAAARERLPSRTAAPRCAARARALQVGAELPPSAATCCSWVRQLRGCKEGLCMRAPSPAALPPAPPPVPAAPRASRRVPAPAQPAAGGRGRGGAGGRGARRWRERAREAGGSPAGLRAGEELPFVSRSAHCPLLSVRAARPPGAPAATAQRRPLRPLRPGLGVSGGSAGRAGPPPGKPPGQLRTQGAPRGPEGARWRKGRERALRRPGPLGGRTGS